MKHNIGRIIIVIILVAAAVVFNASHDTDSAPVKPVNDSEAIPLPSPKPSISIPEPTPEPSVEAEMNNTEENYTKKETTPDADTAFIININGERIKVAYGVDETTLKKTPGWLENSAYPGEDGVCVVYGHRNRNHLRALKGAYVGDTITVETTDGSCTYVVETIRIMDGDEDLTIPTLEGKHLMLSTCYPFHYSGSAPQKYVVTAKIIS